MTPELIAKLLAPKQRKAKVSKATGGSFQGKAGTMRKSRKGNSRRLANGTRFYAPTTEEWQAVGLLNHLKK